MTVPLTVPPCRACSANNRTLVTTKDEKDEDTGAVTKVEIEPIWHCPDCGANEVPFPPAE